MKSCARPEDRERGAVSVLIAILMVSLLGFTALAVDVGMLYAERTQLRNGADAAALAIAQKCARNIPQSFATTNNSPMPNSTRAPINSRITYARWAQGRKH